MGARRRAVPASVIAAAVLLSGCAADSAGSDVAGEWALVEWTAAGQAVPMPSGGTVTLTLDDGQAGGTSFCNHYFSSYRSSGTSFSIDGIGGTEMACEPDVMAAETAYLTALDAVDRVAVDDDLVLTGDDIRMRFTPVAPVPDSPLEGTRWVLESVLDGETAASTLGEPAVLLLGADLRASASTGCRSITGTWLVEDGALVIDDLLADGGACPADVARQDAHVTAVLSGAAQVEITEDRLTLTGDDGRGLVYRAQ